jgi:antitoxin CptB
VTEIENTAGLDVRRRKLLFRCWHRGTREMDLLLGRYADRHLAGMGEAELADLEALMEAPDPELFHWITGSKPAPANFDLPILQAIRDYHRDNPTTDAV